MACQKPKQIHRAVVSIMTNFASSKIALYFTSKYGLQTKEFEDILNNNNIEFKKNSGNIFIPNSEITNYELVVDDRTKKIILDFIENNRLSHIKKTGEHLIQIED